MSVVISCNAYLYACMSIIRCYVFMCVIPATCVFEESQYNIKLVKNNNTMCSSTRYDPWYDHTVD